MTQMYATIPILLQILQSARYLLFLCIPMTYAVCSNAQEWTLKKDRDGIKVYTKESASGYDTFRATLTLKCNIHGLVYLVKDVQNAPKWMYKIKEIRMINEVDYSNWNAWSSVGMPWPIEDRDIVTTQKLTKSDNEFRIDVKSIPSSYKKVEGHVRIENAQGYWLFIQNNDQTVDIVYEFQSDPGGIPAWIVNAFVEDSPFNTLLGMKRMILMEPYRSIQLNYL
ncbi:MAG: hypothetical protein RIE58_10645 [Vicingaceae bacterium]